MNIYVGNLSTEVTEADLRAAFEPFGTPTSVSIIKDKFTGEPRGFAFVEMPTEEGSALAISQLNGKELKGRAMKANEARGRSDSGSRDTRGRNGSYANRSTRYY